MPKEETQRKIIEKAFELISKLGYNNVSARRIARDVGISVSTLFYHYPEGLIDILVGSVGYFQEKMQIKKVALKDQVTEKDLYEFFHRQLILGRKMRTLTFALESALFADPEHFNQKANKILSKGEPEEFKEMWRIYEKVIDKKLKIGLFKKLISIWKALLRRHIIFNNIYGSDEEFINMMLRILRAAAEED